jgi:hypothetical protein
MADYIGATPQVNPLMGLLAERLKQAQEFAAKPFGYSNPPAEMLMNLLGIPAIQQTAERIAYDEPLTTGSGMTTQIRPEVMEAAMTLAPTVGLLGKATKGLPVGASIKPVDDIVGLLTPKKLSFDVAKRDASDIFGVGAERIKYTDPKSGGMIEVLAKPDGSASVLGLEVPETARGKGIGQSLQAQVMQDFPEMMGQVSSKAAAKTAYRLGRRPPNMPDATLDDVYKMMKEDSSVNLVSPQMQKRFMPEQAQDFVYPQEEAMRLAQQRAALPVEQGGLGLLANNTAAERAAAQGGKEAIHFSRTGGDFNVLDSGQYAVAPFDAVGTHVGTKEAALDRFRNTSGTIDTPRGSTYPVQVLGDRPLMNEQGLPWSEDELNAYLRKTGGHNWSDVNGGKMTYQDMNKDLRKKLFEEQGYTSIPYVNDVEAKGAVSYIVPPDNLRSRFAAFDPFRRSAAIAASMGVAAPDLLAEETDKPKKRLNLLD